MPNAITEENSIEAASDLSTLESGNLTSSGTLSGTEIVPVSKGGLFQTTVRAIAAFTNQLVNPTTLNVVSPLTGTEVAAISQGGSLLQATLSAIAGYVNGLINPANLNAANTLTGSELLGVNQSNSLVKLTLAALTTFVLSQQATASTLISDTGIANAYQAANPTPLTTGTWVTGTVQQFVVGHTNTGASTYSPDGLSPIPILGEGFLPLVGGELLGNCVARLMRLTIPGVNSGNPFCVLVDCTGAVKQVTPGTASSHAATFGQVTTAVNSSASALTAAITNAISAATGTITTAYTTSQQTQATNVGIDTGTANAYVVAFSPSLPSPIPWVPFWFEVKTTNTGASTLNATGTAYPLLGGAHLALQGGELISAGNALVYWNPTLNSGVGAYVLLFCSGAPEQIAPATQPYHAVQLAQLQQVGHGQCRLTATSGTVLTLAPFNGDNVIVNGVYVQLPAAGLTVSNATLAASTLYYAYLGGTTGSLSLTLSTTGHTLQPNGVVTMTGNPALTLVGMVYTSTATPGQFVSTPQNQLTRDWFQRRRLPISTGTASNSTSSTTYVAMGTIVQLLAWADEMFEVGAYGVGYNATAGGGVEAQLYVNGVAGASTAGLVASPSANYQYNFVSRTTSGGIVEGLYTFQLYALNLNGTNAVMSWAVQGSVG